MTEIRKIVALLFAGLIAIFVQTALIRSYAPEWFVTPNVVLVIVAFVGFYETSVLGVVLAFLLGIEFDLASGILLGPCAAAFVVVFLIVSSVSQRIFVGSPFAAFLAVLGASPVATVIYLALLYRFKPPVLAGWSFVLTIVTEAILSAVLAPVVFNLLKRFVLGAGAGRSRGASL